jgi:L-ascorbate metabolism protein UlaG (beta-lactamase superfamily)
MSSVAATGVRILLFLSVLACTPHHRGPVTDHFDGHRFHDAEPDHSFGDMVRWMWELEPVPWPRWIDDPVQPPPPVRVAGGRLRATFVNHATVLLQLDGLNVVTDPIWSDRASPVAWAGPRRVRRPGVRLEDLPPVDLVLVSHDHYDHLDAPTLRALEGRDHPLVIAGLGVGARLRALGMSRVVELDWWQGQAVEGGITVTFVPARHRSGRGLLDGGRTLWGGFVIEGPAGRVYFAGDTGYGAFVDELAARYPGFRLAVLPVGSYEKRWFMRGQHMSPDDAVRAHLALHAERSMGMHYATFEEHPEQAIDAHEADLAAALRAHGLPPDRFRLLAFGEGVEVGPSFTSSEADPP